LPFIKLLGRLNRRVLPTGIANPDFPRHCAIYPPTLQSQKPCTCNFNAAGGILRAGKYNDGSADESRESAQGELADGMPRMGNNEARTNSHRRTFAMEVLNVCPWPHRTTSMKNDLARQ
jgi:hypothetical protein